LVTDTLGNRLKEAMATKFFKNIEIDPHFGDKEEPNTLM
jgi:hypothetical protein